MEPSVFIMIFFVPLFYSFPLFPSSFSFILTPFLSDFTDKRAIEAEVASAYFKCGLLACL
jgi:hypothetical protein